MISTDIFTKDNMHYPNRLKPYSTKIIPFDTINFFWFDNRSKKVLFDKPEKWKPLYQ